MKEDGPLVSVVVNCLNSEKFLREALDSVYAQTYCNWEIVFWDNNSSDQSAVIAQSYDSKLRYFKADETTTLYTARNCALKRCSGAYIAFLDCDDIWLPRKLEKQVALASLGNNIVYGGYDCIDIEGQKISENLNYLVSGDITNSLFKRNSISIGCVFAKAEILKRARFDPYYDLLGDYDLWVKLSLTNKFAVVPEVVEHSREHSANISTTLSHKWVVERRYFYKKYLSLKNLVKYPWLAYYILKTEVLGLSGRN